MLAWICKVLVQSIDSSGSRARGLQAERAEHDLLFNVSQGVRESSEGRIKFQGVSESQGLTFLG